MELRGLTPLLQVYDMPASIRFYRDLLGFHIHSHAPHRGGEDPDRFHWVWLKRGDLNLMLNTAYEFDEERPVPPDPARVAAHGDTVLYFDCPDLDAAFQQLRARLPDLAPPHLTGYGMRELSFHDPDSYLISLLSAA